MKKKFKPYPSWPALVVSLLIWSVVSTTISFFTAYRDAPWYVSFPVGMLAYFVVVLPMARALDSYASKSRGSYEASQLEEQFRR